MVRIARPVPHMAREELSSDTLAGGVCRALPVYLPVYVVPALLVHRKRLLNPKMAPDIGRRVALGALRSSLFLALYCTLAWRGACVGFQWTSKLPTSPANCLCMQSSLSIHKWCTAYAVRLPSRICVNSRSSSCCTCGVRPYLVGYQAHDLASLRH